MTRRETGPTNNERPGAAALGRPLTIYDVAREAGVATSTVSRTLAHPERVNERTRGHVLEVAERLGYRSNRLARALSSGKTATMAIIVADVTNPFFSGLIRGAEQQARIAGFSLVLADSEEAPELEALHVERLTGAVDAFILAASRLSETELQDLARTRVVGLVNREVHGVPSVSIDHVEGPRQVVAHLSSLGHRSIVYLGRSRTSWSNEQRWRALSNSARQNGITITRLGPFRPTVEAGGAAADAAIAQGSTAIVAYNDLLAIGTMRRLGERGVAVPADVSVVGFGDVFGADFCSPPLTTVAFPIQDLGRTAVDLVLGLLAPQTTHARRHIELPCELRIRQSTAHAR